MAFEIISGSDTYGTWYAGNGYLSEEYVESNARYIAASLAATGWSKNSIAAMLGNMETESGINSGIWEGLDASDPARGYGLVQWTPSTKYTAFCEDRGVDPAAMSSALMMINNECSTGIQWISTDTYPLTFAEFKVSTQTPEYLAQAFLYNYERPASLDQPARSTQARKWYTFLYGSGGGNKTTHKKHKMSFVVRLMAIRRR